MIPGDERKRRVRWVGRAAAMLFGAMTWAVGPLRAAEPKALFARHCVSCHGPDGKARTPIGRKLGVKDLTQSTATDAQIEKQVIEGTKDSRGLPRMPPFKDKMTAAEIQSLIGWVKTLRK